MKLLNVAILAASLGSSAVAFANTGTITINGRIYSETCVLKGDSPDASGKGDIIVTLPTIATTAFNAGSIPPNSDVNFDVSLVTETDQPCIVNDNTVPTVTLTVENSKLDSDNKKLLVNQDTTVAKKVSVQILAKPNKEGAGEAVDFSNTTNQAKATYDQDKKKFYYTAQYNAGSVGTPDAQIVKVQATYNITYP